MATSQSIIDNKLVYVERLISPLGFDLLTTPSLPAYQASIGYDTTTPDKLYVSDGINWYDASTPCTIGDFNTTPNAKGLIINNVFGTQEIELTKADATHPGGVSADAQTFGGDKTFSKVITPIITNTGAVSIGPGSSLLDFNNVPIANFAGSLGSGVYSAATPVDATNNFGINIDNGLNRINLFYANATYGGILSDAAQAIKGKKTFNDNIALPTLSTTGLVHNDASGNLTTSLLVDADVSASAAIVDTKLATISTASKVSNSATTATSSNTASAIVARDAFGNFTANSITANLIGNASTATSSTNFSGALAGDVTGTQGSTVVAFVGGQSAAVVASSTVLTSLSTNLNTPSAIVRRDISGNFAAGTITATLNGNASTATSATTFTGLLAGDVTGNQGSTTVAFVGGASASIVASTVNDVASATSLNVGGTLVRRTALGDFNGRDILGVNLSCTGNINLTTTASPTIGVIVQNGNRYIHSIGTNCFFAGQLAGNPASASGARSTGVGYSALNVALAGADNSAFGYNALLLSTGGTNSAFGSSCLAANTSGVRNTAMGYEALLSCATVNDNVAIGYRALRLQTSGGNTVVGSNSATAATGINNTSLGTATLFNLTTGTTNIAIGANAGSGLTTGSNNIYIGVAALSATDSSVCRINSIRGVTTGSATGINVLVDANGQLGTVSSTRDKKENIIAMDPIQNSDIIRKLQPRRFDYKSCKGEYQQYGLIVDEVESVCPDLIAKKSDGTPETVYYNFLPMILLQEVQTLRKELDELKLSLRI